MHNPIISIFIPTFNRSKYLDECLSSIINEVSAFNIVILISDNASTDTTEQVVMKQQKKYKYITYIKQPTNIGLDRNQLAFLHHIKTKYCLLIADDDTLYKESFSNIQQHLYNDKEYDLVLLNAVHFTEDMKQPKHINMDINNNKIIDDPLHFLDKYIFFMHFSTIIFNMNHLQLISYEKYIGTYHAYCGIVFEYLKEIYENNNKVNIKIIEEPLIIIRDGKKTYSFEKIEVYFNKFPLFFDKLPNFYKTISDKKLIQLMNSYTKTLVLINLRIEGLLTRTNRYKYHYYLNSNQKIKLFLFSIIPIEVIVLGRYFFRKIKALK
jgi:abequosyltransferase